MTEKYKDYNRLLEMVCLGHDNNTIKNELGVSLGQIYSVRSKVNNLKYDPLIVDDKLCCYRCKRNDKDFHIHHSHKTNQWIAIVCRDCNYVVEDADAFSPISNKTKYDFSYIRKLEREWIKLEGKEILIELGKYLEEKIKDCKKEI